jgi:23S rRNA (guanosine2251-2'-O)-methyltransferase
MEHAKVARVTNLVRTLADLKSQNLWVYGFEAEAPKTYTELDYSQGCVLVLGGEGRGLHRLVREVCDERAHIPLQGPVSSKKTGDSGLQPELHGARLSRGKPGEVVHESEIAAQHRLRGSVTGVADGACRPRAGGRRLGAGRRGQGPCCATRSETGFP